MSPGALVFKQRWFYLLAAAVLMLVAGLVFWWYCGIQSTVLLVRHADRNGTLDELSEAGQARAQALVHTAERAGIAAIIRSDTVRAEQTAQLIATALGLTPSVVDGGNVDAFANEIRKHSGRTVLVIGHSNTVTPIIAALGGPSLPQIGETEFDNFYVLKLCRCSRNPARLTHLQYGAPSP
jgi:broad specificity phosphatase PhoE